MAAVDSATLMAAAKCYDKCIPDGMKLSALIAIYAEALDMTREEVMSAANCYFHCIPTGMQPAALVALTLDILTSGTGGLGGVFYGTTAERNATTPLGNAAIWILSDSDPVGILSYWNGSSWI